MSKTPLIPHIPLLPHNIHQSSLLPDPSKIISDPANLIPDPSKILTDTAKLIPDPSKILSNSTKLIPSPSEVLSDTAYLLTEPSKIISDLTKLIPDPSKILSDTTKLIPNPSKILSDATKLLTEPSKILSPSPLGLVSQASKTLSPTNLITGPSKILSSLLSSATNNPITSILAQLLNPAEKLLALLMLPLSFSLGHFLVVGAILLLLVGLIVAGTVVGLIIWLPLMMVLSPIWVPASTALFVVTAGLLSMCGFALVVVIVVAWLLQHLFNSLD